MELESTPKEPRVMNVTSTCCTANHHLGLFCPAGLLLEWRFKAQPHGQTCRGKDPGRILTRGWDLKDSNGNSTLYIHNNSLYSTGDWSIEVAYLSMLEWGLLKTPRGFWRCQQVCGKKHAKWWNWCSDLYDPVETGWGNLPWGTSLATIQFAGRICRKHFEYLAWFGYGL